MSYGGLGLLMGEAYRNQTDTALTPISKWLSAKAYYRPTGQTVDTWFTLEASGFEDYAPALIQGFFEYDSRPDVRVATPHWFIAKPTLTSGNVEAFGDLLSTGINLLGVVYSIIGPVPNPLPRNSSWAQLHRDLFADKFKTGGAADAMLSALLLSLADRDIDPPIDKKTAYNELLKIIEGTDSEIIVRERLERIALQ